MEKSRQHYQPAEWNSHRACWLAWPSAADLWEENLAPAQKEFTALCHAIATDRISDASRPREKLEILVPTAKDLEVASRALASLPVRFHSIKFGDIWVRDTGPIFMESSDGLLTAQFGFNGWGGKYVLPHDDQVSREISQVADVPTKRFDWILEGGSIEVDGEGSCLTSKQCLLNPNRNPQFSQSEIEQRLSEALGVQKVLWLDEGLLNDHTDGHIDTFARYIAPGVIMCMEPSDASDPNYQVMRDVIRDLQSFTDARGRSIRVVTVPSPGKIVDEDGEIMPASYLNFYIGNQSVVVPIYGSPNDEKAVSEIAKHFPGRRTLGLSAKAILSGGGAFHCITQQEPLTSARKL